MQKVYLLTQTLNCQAQLSPSYQLQPSWLIFSLTLHFIHPTVPVDSKLHLGKDSSSSHSWHRKQAQLDLVGSPLKQALFCISSTKTSLYASRF